MGRHVDGPDGTHGWQNAGQRNMERKVLGILKDRETHIKSNMEGTAKKRKQTLILCKSQVRMKQQICWLWQIVCVDMSMW